MPAERRGEGIGLAGVVACVPAIVALPSGVWLAQNTGYVVVIAITAISALAPLAASGTRLIGVGISLVYSFIKYKTPWLLVDISLPCALLLAMHSHCKLMPTVHMPTVPSGCAPSTTS